MKIIKVTLVISIHQKNVQGLYLREFFPQPSENRQKAVLFLHGYPGNQKNYDLAEHLAFSGFRCFVMHYRGAWKSEGQYSLLSIYRDVELMLKNMEEEGFSRDEISLIGVSWGGFVALEILARNPALFKVILVAPFINIDHDEKKLQAGAEFLSSITKPGIKNYEREQIIKDLKVIQKEYNPLDKINLIDGRKILIIHGSKDQICPIKYSIRLKSQFKEPARLYQLTKEDHFIHERELLYEFCSTFLKQ